MDASLAIVAVGNAVPVWLGRGGVVLTPVRLSASYGSRLEDDWGSIGRDPGRGDAVRGRFAGIATDSAIEYSIWQSFSLTNGRFVNYYA